MSFRPLDNYLRAYRKQLGLKQSEVAAMIGCARCQISRYERRHRLPCLRIVRTYEALSGVPAAELFAGVLERAHKDTKRWRLKLDPRIDGNNPTTTGGFSIAHANRHRVFALSVHSQSFGFVVFEDSNRLLDWGVRSFRSGMNAVKIQAGEKLSALLNEYKPAVIVMPELAKGTYAKTVPMLATLHQQILSRRISVTFIPRYVANAKLAGPGSNKDDVASILAKQFPVIASKLPPKRKIWQSEDYRMGIFDAMALGAAYLSL